MRSTVTARPARAPAIALRPPLRIPPRAPRTLEETLISVGIVPRGRAVHGLLWRWFAHESTLLAFGNAAASLVLALLALTMTAIGMQLAVALNAAATIYAVLNDGMPYVGLALFAFAALKAVHAYFDRRASLRSRALGFALAFLLFAAGMWLEVMLGYADFVPWMFKPVLALAAGAETTARVSAVNAALVSYFEPALALFLALLLGAKQIKSALAAEKLLGRKRLAVFGLVMSLGVAALGAEAGYRHYTGADKRDGLGFAIGGDAGAAGPRTYGSLFAPGVQCHVSSLYGWRDDPLSPGHAQHHQGVDLAVKAGTPVHAMADGRVLFAEFDAGLGNFVALQTQGGGAPTIVNGHMEKLLVSAGDMVRQGDVIGLAGSTGRSTGPHVHLQLCPGGHMHKGGFICGGSTNPYENWPTLAALAQMSCVDGPAIF